MILNLKAKHGDYPVYARDSVERDRAYLHLFNLMNGWGFYNDLSDDLLTWYTAAKMNDARSARWLLDYRSDRGYEYETIETIHPVTP